MRRFGAVIIMAGLSLCLAILGHESARAHPERPSQKAMPPVGIDPSTPLYQLSMNADYLLTTKVCGKTLPMRLVTEARGLSGFTPSIRRVYPDGKEQSLALFGRHLPIPRAKDGGCVIYQVDLKRAGEVFDHQNLAKFRGRALLVSPDLFIWYPSDLQEKGMGNPHIHLLIEAGHWGEFAAPWPRDEKGHYRIASQTFSQLSRVVLGHFEVREWEVAGSQVRLAKLSEESRYPLSETVIWIEKSLLAVAQIVGRMPQSPLLMVVDHMDFAFEPVPWAHVLRGGGATVEVVASQHLKGQALAEDWVMAHELSHLLLPPIHRRDAWFSEGMATYYQNLSRARAHLISPEEAWTAFYRGFEKARAAGLEHSLEQASAHMRQNLAFKRVYWGGAAYFLAVDFALRTRSTNPTSVEALLSAYHAHGIEGDAPLKAVEMITQLDALSGGQEFRQAYEAFVAGRQFPPVFEILHGMGVHQSKNGLELDAQSPHYHRAQAILLGS